MADLPLKGIRVAILATDGVEKIELTLPRLSLEEAGADTALLAPKPQIQSMNHDEKDDRFAVDMLLKDAQPEEFDAVMLPGGALNADKLRIDMLNSARFLKSQKRSTGKLGVYTMGPRLDGVAGVSIQRHDLVPFRQAAAKGN